MRERNIPWQWTTSIRISFRGDQLNIGSARRYFRVRCSQFSLDARIEPVNWLVFDRHIERFHPAAPLKAGASMP